MASVFTVALQEFDSEYRGRQTFGLAHTKPCMLRVYSLLNSLTAARKPCWCTFWQCVTASSAQYYERSTCAPPACIHCNLVLLQTFIKVANYQHIMPTRYTLDTDLKGLVTTEAVENSSKRSEACKVSATEQLFSPLLQQHTCCGSDTES